MLCALSFPLSQSLLAQNNFTQKLDSMGLPGREMEICTYLPDGNMLTLTKIYNDDGEKGSYQDRRTEYTYDSNGKVELQTEYGRDDDESDWSLQARIEYEHNDAGRTTSIQFRLYNTNEMSWNADPYEGNYYTYNDDNLLIQREIKEDSGSGYHTSALLEYSYYDDNRLEQEFITVFNFGTGIGILYEEKKDFTYANENSGTGIVKQRNLGQGSFDITGKIGEIYADGKLVERILFDYIGITYFPVKRELFYFSPQGFNGGWTFQDYVNNAWQLNFDNLTIFDDYGNPISNTASDFVEEINAAQPNYQITFEYDLNQLAESTMLPYNRHLTSRPPINLPIYRADTLYQNGIVSETYQYEYYYSDYLVNTSTPAVNPEIVLYPNPAQTEIRFALNEPTSSLDIKIIDLQGRIVMHEHLKPTASLNIQSLSAGAYQCIVRHGDNLALKRFIVE
jgi:hypothetical protein